MSIIKKREKAPIEIEDAINARLTGDARKNLLDWAASMRENGFSFIGFTSGNGGGSIAYKGKSIGCMDIAQVYEKEHVDFVLWLFLDCEFDSDGADDELKEFAWAHVPICRQEKYCKKYCNLSRNRWQIFEREFESVCHAPLAFWNPDANDFENIKKLLLRLK